MTDRATHSTGEHQPDVTINENAKVDVKFVFMIGGPLIAGILAFATLQAQVNAQGTRITGLEKVMCAVAKKLDVVVAECSGN